MFHQEYNAVIESDYWWKAPDFSVKMNPIYRVMFLRRYKTYLRLFEIVKKEKKNLNKHIFSYFICVICVTMEKIIRKLLLNE